MVPVAKKTFVPYFLQYSLKFHKHTNVNLPPVSHSREDMYCTRIQPRRRWGDPTQERIQEYHKERTQRSYPGKDTWIAPWRGYRDPTRERLQGSCPGEDTAIQPKRGYRVSTQEETDQIVLSLFSPAVSQVLVTNPNIPATPTCSLPQ
jgi:hypothetical protein